VGDCPLAFFPIPLFLLMLIYRSTLETNCKHIKKLFRSRKRMCLFILEGNAKNIELDKKGRAV
jgi:hypothetical protein